MEQLAWWLVGGVAALSANVILHSRIVLIADIIVCVLGALAGGFLFSLIGQVGVAEFNLWSVIAAFLAAMIFLGLVRRNRKWFTQSPAVRLAHALQDTEGLISNGKRDSQYGQQ